MPRQIKELLCRENCRANESALAALKARIAKARTDAKANKGAIMQGLTNYARYGAKNPFNDVISDTEMEKITATELVNLLHNLSKYSHKIIYYGPQSLIAFKPAIKKLHPLPFTWKQAAPATLFTPSVQNKNQVLYANYDMVQAEVIWLRNNNKYNESEEPVINVFNNYFGFNMSSIVFQTIRESKALAYSTYAYYITPDKKDDPFVSLAYIGCQADKFNEAVTAMNELLTTLPKVNENLNNARVGIKKDIETERITQDNIIFNYLAAQRKGLKSDIRKQTYTSVDKINFEQLQQFYKQNIANKPYTYCILASENKISASDIAKLGEVKKLTLKELFGY